MWRRYNARARQELISNLLRIAYSRARTGAQGPGILIDRDGVINRRRPGDYVLSWSEFTFTPGIRPAMKQLSSLGLPMIIISNQAAVGKGLLDLAGLEDITVKMHRSLLDDGILVSAVYYCPHRADENCACRKPKPALLVRAAEDFNIDLRRSIFIGDSDTDVQAAQAAGCNPILFASGIGEPCDSRATGNLPFAQSADDLFRVASKSLKDCQNARPSIGEG
jgi:D-glycero-D-manno-heptose 1,7-bisphosphate phosphatase